MWVIPQILECKIGSVFLQRSSKGGMMSNLSMLKQPVPAMHGQGSAEPGNREPQVQCRKGFHRVSWEKAGRQSPSKAVQRSQLM